MWNFNFMLPSILMFLIMQCYYFAWPRLPVRINRAFQALIYVDCLVIIFDLASSLADADYAAHSSLELYYLNMLFFVLYFVRILCFFLFTIFSLHIDYKKRPVLAIGTVLVFAAVELITLSSPYTGAVFKIGAEGYQRGPAYDLLPVVFFFYIIYSLILLYRFRRRLSMNQKVCAFAAQLVLLAGCIVRILLPQYIVMNMFCFMAIFILFLGFQNPAMYRSSGNNTFNLRGLQMLLEDASGRRSREFFAFALKNYSDERGMYGISQMDKGIAAISSYLAAEHPELIVFYLRNGYFAMVGKKEMDVRKLQADLQERFRHPWTADGTDLYLRAGFAYIRPDARLDTPEHIMDILYVSLEQAASPDRPDDQLVDLSSIEALQRMTSVKHSLERAIKEESIEVYLMPIVDAATWKIKYAEALARIRDEEGQIISPLEFILLAERSGQINDVGIQVLKKTCRFYSDYHPDQHGISWINVNLSPIQFMNRNLCGQFLGILHENQVTPERIHLEITEQTMLDDPEVKNQTDVLETAGFHFSLDDFGQGYSNLTRLYRFPFVDVKLDMEIVQDYYNKRDILLPSLIHTLKELGFSITAEGIETEDMARVMREAGCDYLQGYYFSKPLPMDEFADRYMTKNDK